MPIPIYAEHTKLSFEQAATLCHEFIGIGDKVFDYMDSLYEAGFQAFVPYHEFLESFASNQAEIDFHRRYVRESAKERLGRPWPMSLMAPHPERIYSSPFIKSLKDERDKVLGVSSNDFGTRYHGSEIWRLEVDPCEQRRVYAEIHEKESYKLRWDARLQVERKRLGQEILLHGSGISKAHSFDKRGRYAFFRAVMERDAASLGFHRDPVKSSSTYPLFSKRISEDWELCWTIEEARSFYRDSTMGYFVPYLTIRNRKLTGRKAAFGERLFIQYQYIVTGFGNGYWKFYSLDELEVMIKAHLYLYSLMAPILEKSLHKVLGFSLEM